jgi:hypothetical protein
LAIIIEIESSKALVLAKVLFGGDIESSVSLFTFNDSSMIGNRNDFTGSPIDFGTLWPSKFFRIPFPSLSEVFLKFGVNCRLSLLRG